MNTYMNRIATDPRQNVVLAKEVLGAYEAKTISKDDKNAILRRIIAVELPKTHRVLNVGFEKNRCQACAGRGFIIIPELVRERGECLGSPDEGILPCGGTGILTKVCQRCNGMTLIQLIAKEREKLDKLPSDSFIAEHGSETFRLIEADEMGGKGKYFYIPKKPCKACGGTGRFVYKNDQRTVVCSCVKKRLVPTGNIHKTVECDVCHGDGRRLDNPVISIGTLSAEVREVIERIIK